MVMRNLHLPDEWIPIRNQLVASLNQQIEQAHLPENILTTRVDAWIDQMVDRVKSPLTSEQRTLLTKQVLSEVIGYGPLQPLLDDEEISEIMVTGPQQVYIERDGELFDTGIKFKDDQHVLQIIDRIIRPLGRSVGREAPMVDARLPNGSRVNIVIPPVAIDGPCITIRKFLRSKLLVQDFIDYGSLTKNMAEFLRACVVARLNILITGNTSSGKTTLLNILSEHIPDDERIITIEDAAEIQLRQKYVVRLETRPPNNAGEGEVVTRDLVRNALRMRPDRIIVGEVRSGEALDMLQAMNTGHTGSITTLHANSPRDAISRLETMSMMAGLDIPLTVVRRQIASAINLIVHMARLEDGSRKATYITEVAGMEGDVVTLSDIFRFERTGVSAGGKVLGELRPTRIRPLFSPRLEAAGFRLTGDIFGAGSY
jgi:pilus assembly protein CpaF